MICWPSPLAVRIRGNVEVDDLSAIVTENDEDVKYAKRGGQNRKEIASCCNGHAIGQPIAAVKQGSRQPSGISE